jgi:hypothetical protein
MKQSRFAFKADAILTHQAKLDRACTALNLFLDGLTHLRAYRIESMLMKREQLTPRAVEAPKLVYTERQKISCLFVDEDNTGTTLPPTP